jgi:hypothetical protein
MNNTYSGNLPRILPSNPGKGTKGKVAFKNPERDWVEEFDLVALLLSVFKEQGHKIHATEKWLLHEESGFMLQPQVTGVQPLEKGGVQTVSTIQVNHPQLAPAGLFEYQHATGSDVADSFHKGFESWAMMDLVTLLDAQRTKPETCTFLEMEFPEKDGRPAYKRRAILGPPSHLIQNPQAAEAQSPENPQTGSGEACDEHPFCPCCLLTNSFDAFNEQLRGREFLGLRLLAARDANGLPQADCRINGDDWAPGTVALCKYAATWPPAGFEMRKQYVVLQTIEKKC